MLLLLLACFVQAAPEPLECTAAPAHRDWPIYHAFNNLTNGSQPVSQPASQLGLTGWCCRPSGLKLGHLNDANAIFEYVGNNEAAAKSVIAQVVAGMWFCHTRSPPIVHRDLKPENMILCNSGIANEHNGNWTHAVSADLVRWFHIQDALDSGGPSIKFPDKGPCDGSVSFPHLGVGPFNGSAPIILYDADCGTPLPKNQTPPSGPFSPHKVPGDVARIEVAKPVDTTDPYLRHWHKSTPGPVTFDGLPCAFPSIVWKSSSDRAHDVYWNMLCAVDSEQPWARYSSYNPTLMEWHLADPQFTTPIALGCYKCTQTGIMFRPLPNPPADGPTHIINGNVTAPGRCRHDAFYLGRYDTATEKFDVNMTLGPQLLEDGCGDSSFPAGRGSWAVAGSISDGRLLKVDWVKEAPPCGGLDGWCTNVASLVRELLYDHDAEQLLMRPVAEYALLHNATFVDNQTIALSPSELVTLDIPPERGGAIDVNVSFDLGPVHIEQAASGFGIAVRSERDTLSGAGVVLSFNVSVGHQDGIRHVSVSAGADAQVPPVKVMQGELLKVRLLVDRPIVEVFLMGGRAAFVATKVKYDPNATAVHLFNYGIDNVTARDISVKGMGCGWAAALPEPRN